MFKWMAIRFQVCVPLFMHAAQAAWFFVHLLFLRHWFPNHWDIQMCHCLNSLYFHIIGDGHQPNNRVFYTNYKDSYWRWDDHPQYSDFWPWHIWMFARKIAFHKKKHGNKNVDVWLWLVHFFAIFVQYSLQISSPPQCQMILSKGSLALTWRELIENATGKNQLHRKVRSQQVRWKTTIEISSKRSWRDWRNFQVFCRCSFSDPFDSREKTRRKKIVESNCQLLGGQHFFLWCFVRLGRFGTLYLAAFFSWRGSEKSGILREKMTPLKKKQQHDTFPKKGPFSKGKDSLPTIIWLYNYYYSWDMLVFGGVVSDFMTSFSGKRIHPWTLGSMSMFSEGFLLDPLFGPPVSLLKKKGSGSSPHSWHRTPLGCPPRMLARHLCVGEGSFGIYLKDLKMPAETPGGDDDWASWAGGQQHLVTASRLPKTIVCKEVGLWASWV